MTAIAHGAPAHAPSADEVNGWLISFLSRFGLGLGVFLSGFVIDEPAPYELYMVGLIAVWGLFGLRISRTVAPLLALLVVFNIGGMISTLQMGDLYNAPLYNAVSLFLAFTAVFYAAVIENNWKLLPVIFDAYLAAAVITAILGILGYFHAFPGAGMFTLYDRAKGAFQDPNVFGPFLLLPSTWLVYRLLTGTLAAAPMRIAPLLVIGLGIFLSFSRAAWGLTAFTIGAMTLLVFIHNRNNLFRLRIILLAGAAVILLAAAVIIALQVPSVHALFEQRAKLTESYDVAHFGRFARHRIGFIMSMSHPLGIGPLNFGRMYGEDTHNIWLKALLDYGWIGFTCYILITFVTLGAGFRILLRDRPWQPFLLCAYVVYVAHVLIGNIIDTDHWRHFYLLLGIIWGSIALEVRYQRAGHPAARRSPIGAININGEEQPFRR